MISKYAGISDTIVNSEDTFDIFWIGSIIANPTLMTPSSSSARQFSGN